MNDDPIEIRFGKDYSKILSKIRNKSIIHKGGWWVYQPFYQTKNISRNLSDSNVFLRQYWECNARDVVNTLKPRLSHSER